MSELIIKKLFLWDVTNHWAMMEGEGHFVEDVMQKNVISIDTSLTVKDAAKMMTDSQVGCLVVTENNKPVGMLTERDLVRRIISEERSSSEPITKIMSTPLIIAKPDYTLWELAQLMKTKHIHKIPVEKDDRLVGIITATDIVKLHSLASGSEICKITEQVCSRMPSEKLKN